jgi:uncharacterized protein DUF3247
MARVAPRVYVHAVDVARLEHLVEQLPQSRRVDLLLEDGSRLRGIVEMRPGVQAFFDPQGREGMNALLRLEAFLDDGRGHDGGVRNLWLDEIREVTRLPNPSPPEPSTRTAPPDPNAPATR